MIEIQTSSPLALVPLVTHPLSIIQTYINCQQREQKQRLSYVEQPDHLEGYALLWTSLKAVLALFALFRMALIGWAFVGLGGFLETELSFHQRPENHSHILVYLRVAIVLWILFEGLFLVLFTAFFSFVRSPKCAALYTLQTTLVLGLAVGLEVNFFVGNSRPPYWMDGILVSSLLSLLFHLAHNLVVRVDQHHLRSMTALRGSFFSAILKV